LKDVDRLGPGSVGKNWTISGADEATHLLWRCLLGWHSDRPSLGSAYAMRQAGTEAGSTRVLKKNHRLHANRILSRGPATWDRWSCDLALIVPSL
jgi:hypothetical protein